MHTHSQFWREQPALLVALCLLIGTSSYLFWPSPWNWIWPLLWTAYLISLRNWPLILFFIGSIAYSWILSPKITEADKGYFSIASVQPHATPFQKGLLYRGMLFSNGSRIPCSVFCPSTDRPPANCDYILLGKLIPRGSYEYGFKAKKWIPVKK